MHDLPLPALDRTLEGLEKMTQSDTRLKGPRGILKEYSWASNELGRFQIFLAHASALLRISITGTYRLKQHHDAASQ